MLFSPRPKLDTSSLPDLSSLITDTPFLLLPVRVQIKFRRETSELLVRIYPDQVSIDYHEPELTDSEVLAGKQYWRQALTAPDRQKQVAHSSLAWQVLLGRYGANRAGWIVQSMTPNEPSNVLNELIEHSDSIIGSKKNPQPEDWPEEFYDKLAKSFPEHKPNQSAWKRAALAKCLPDRFVVALYNKIPSVKSVQDAYMKEQIVDNFTVEFNWRDVPHPSTPSGTVIPPHETGPKEEILSQDAYENEVTDLTAEFLEVARVEAGFAIQDNEMTVGLSGGSDGNELSENSGLEGNLKWLSNFDHAVEAGMGLAIKLTEEELRRGFDRLVVVGVRAGVEPKEEAVKLGDLLRAHAYTNGLGLVPQGTPTNNTSGQGSGYSSADQYDAETTFKTLLQAPLYRLQPPDAPREGQRDGQRLAEALGIPGDFFTHTNSAGGTDGQEATRFNRVLWPATFGYYMREMLEPANSSQTVTTQARRFFEDYVTGRGPVFSFRVGSTPYGVLPTTWYSQWYPLEELGDFGKLSWDIIRRLDVTWTERLNAFAKYPPDFKKETPFFSPPPSRQDILTVLGQDASSVEFYQRYFVGPSLMDTLAHRAEYVTQQTGSQINVWAPQFDIGGISRSASPRINLPARYQGQPENMLYSNFLTFFDPRKSLGWDRKTWSYAFDVNYQVGYRKVVHTYADEPKPQPETVGPIVDSAPISEINRIKPLRPGRNAGPDTDPQDPKLHNYVHWLANSNFDEIYTQDFTRELGEIPKGFEVPNSLLYHTLRQAVLWRYWEAGEIVVQELLKVTIPRRETELFNIMGKDAARWQWLYNRKDWGDIPLYDWLLKGDHPECQRLLDYLETLRSLATLPTARLERLLAEHLDLGNHRLDAWKTGQVLVRLLTQRQKAPEGIYLGAFGWLEQVYAQDESQPNKDGNRDDPDNLGYIHAPTINHGVAAAVLRQGYKSRQFETDPKNPAANRMAVNLSSERVRRALTLMEGIRTGNSLAALLGRDFEEGLVNASHPGTASYGLQIEHLRRQFPYADEKALPGEETRVPNPEQDVKQLVNGLALIKARISLRLPDKFVDYPKHRDFTLGTTVPQVFWDAVLREIDELQNTLDALGDLTVGESIYQAVTGNVEQAAAMLENVAKGKFSPLPDVVHPARAGVTLTHRVLLHLPQNPPDGMVDAWGEAESSALARTEPALNNWLVTFFGNPADILFPFVYRLGTVTLLEGSISLRELGWQPIDLLLMLDPQALRPGSAFDTHLAHLVRGNYTGTPADAHKVGTVTVTYANNNPLRRMGPLLGRIRQLLATSRPANANDLSGPGRLAPGQVTDETAGIDETLEKERLGKVEQDLRDAIQKITAKVTALKALPGPLPANDLRALREELHTWGAYNLPEAYVAASPTATDPLNAAAAVAVLIQRRLNEVARITQEPNLAIRYAEAGKTLLGSNFRLSIPFQLSSATSPEVPVSAYQAYVNAYESRAMLLRNHLENDSLLDEWLQGLAPVRDTMHHLEKVGLLNELLWDGAPEHALPALTPVQLSSRSLPSNEEYWLGVGYPSADKYTPPTDAVSLVQLLPDKYEGTNMQRALWLDEWVELIPHATEDTSLVFHYDQPNTEAPQTALLAVTPNPNGKSWDWDTLLGTVNESLDFAKKRAVEPANLSFTHLGALLPTLVAPVAQEEVTMTLDFRKLIGQPQFKGVPYLPTPNL